MLYYITQCEFPDLKCLSLSRSITVSGMIGLAPGFFPSVSCQPDVCKYYENDKVFVEYHATRTLVSECLV